jgi:hypothetical protein
MTKSGLLIAVALVAPLAAHAAPPLRGDISGAFGNTLLTIDPDGRSRKIWLKPDGSWAGKSRRGLDLAGSWTVKGEKVCLKQSKPRLPGSMCERFPTEIGAGVSVKDPSGKTVQLRLVEGHITK